MSDTLARVAKVFRTCWGTDPATITMATTPDDVGKWDSLGHLNMCAAIEREFKIALDLDEMMEMANVAKIVEVVEKTLGVTA